MSRTLEEFRAALADYETQAMVYGATTADLPLLVAARERVVDLFLAPAPSTTRAPGGESGCACGGNLGGPPMWPVTHSAKKCVQHRATCDAVLELIGAPPWAPPSPVLPEERGTGAEVVEVVGRDVIALPSMCGDGGAEALSTSCAWDPTVECPVPPTRVVDCYKECPFPSIPGFAPAAPETPATGPKETP